MEFGKSNAPRNRTQNVSTRQTSYFPPLSVLYSLHDKAITFSQKIINDIRQLDSTEMKKSLITLQSQENKNWNCG